MFIYIYYYVLYFMSCYFYEPQAGTMPQVIVQCQVQLLELKFIGWREI